MAQIVYPQSGRGDLGSIPGLERSPREGDVTHSSILDWKIPWMEEPGRGHKESDVTEQLTLSLFQTFYALSMQISTIAARTTIKKKAEKIRVSPCTHAIKERKVQMN